MILIEKMVYWIETKYYYMAAFVVLYMMAR